MRGVDMVSTAFINGATVVVLALIVLVTVYMVRFGQRVDAEIEALRSALDEREKELAATAARTAALEAEATAAALETMALRPVSRPGSARVLMLAGERGHRV